MTKLKNRVLTESIYMLKFLLHIKNSTNINTSYKYKLNIFFKKNINLIQKYSKNGK
jgi:hypothetical protein